MSLQAILAIVGALCGTTGSIITAFSVGRVLKELYLGQQFVSVSVEALVTGGVVPLFTGTERRFKAAELGSVKVVWLGVVLLVFGFLLQGVSILL
jgi:hypothetical protein